MAPRTESRLITALFVDVVGSTDTMVHIGPERMQRLLDAAFSAMSTTIEDHGGTVEKYVGDAIFALFGAPVTHVDDAERALRAAAACAQWSIGEESLESRLGVRVGIETGEALVDLAALDNRQRTVVGTPVNLAARLQQHAEPGQILVGPTCREATDGVARFESAGPLTLKGFGAVEAWRLTGFGAEHEVAPIEFIGRAAELAALDDLFAQARRGGARLALILGPPGQGKSRLATEAIHRAAAQGAVRVLQARCRPGAESGINTPLRQLVQADIPDPTPASLRARLAALMGPEAGNEVAAAVSHSAGMEVDAHLLAISRYEQRELIGDAWRRYLAAVANGAILVVWVEDLHWADPVLVRVIDHLTSDVEAPLAVVATARPEFEGSAHLQRRDSWLKIDLEALDPSSSERLARLVAPLLPDVTRAAGNPLFIIELARSRSEAGDVPLTIQAAISARLDELAPAERELLQRVSVVGETFGVRDAALLSEIEPAEVMGSLGRMAHLGFVTPVDALYRFHHALVRDVAYARLPVAERMALHAEYAVQGVDPSDVEGAAHHWWEAVNPSDAGWVWADPQKLGEMRLAAFAVHLAAGSRLEQRNAYEDALGVYQRAVELADEAPSVAAAEAGVGRAFARQGYGDEAWAHWRRAIELYQAGGSDPPGSMFADMLEIATQNWGYFQHLPDDAEVVRLLDEGARIARATGDDVALARLVVQRAAFTNDAAGLREITRILRSPDSSRFADAAARMAQVYTWNGLISRAVETYEGVFDRLVPQGAVINEPEALFSYSLAALHAGDLERSAELANRLLEEAMRRSPHTRGHAHGLQGLLSLARGDWEGVSETALQVERLVDANPDTSFCLLGAASVGYGAIADVLAGRDLPDGLDQLVARMMSEARLAQASTLMVPKVMANQPDVIHGGLRAYAPDVRLWDRMRVLDVCDLMPALALTMLERWNDLDPVLARLDRVARKGGRLAAAVAGAVREEKEAAQGGSAPTHADLLSLGCPGISELLRYRPRSAVPLAT